MNSLMVKEYTGENGDKGDVMVVIILMIVMILMVVTGDVNTSTSRPPSPNWEQTVSEEGCEDLVFILMTIKL